MYMNRLPSIKRDEKETKSANNQYSRPTAKYTIRVEGTQQDTSLVYAQGPVNPPRSSIRMVKNPISRNFSCVRAAFCLALTSTPRRSGLSKSPRQHARLYRMDFFAILNSLLLISIQYVKYDF
jgi:hypothetical protein